jgi:hypothetical protein
MMFFEGFLLPELGWSRQKLGRLVSSFNLCHHPVWSLSIETGNRRVGEPAAHQIEFRAKGHFERIVRVGHIDLNAAIAQLGLDGSGARQNAWK